jgi:hypothetical protein
MKIMLTGLALTALVLPGPAAAHPTNILFDSFGQCQAALVGYNHEERVVHGSFFPSNGAAEINMLNNWQCVYDADLNAWHIEGQPFGGNDLGNGNGKADPGSN